VDENRLELLIAPHDLGELADRTVRAQRSIATRRGVAIELTGEEVVGRVDGDRLAQVLTNLLDNAVRHSPDGGRVRLDIGARDGETHIAVSDDGPGIPPGERARAFERFSRQDPARTRGGAGLGLAICREIVRAHRGRIWIDDRPPPGTTVRVVLPR
jgi:signal transduction histidine kinase